MNGMEEDSMKVSVQYKELKVEFEGKPEDVYRNLISFMEKTIPTYSLASKLQYSISLQEMIEKLEGQLAYVQGEGIVILKTLSSMSTAEAIMLYCTKRYLEHDLGLSGSPSVSASELSKAVAKPEKTVSGELSRLLQKGYIRRLDRGEYVVTMLGIKDFIENKV